MSSNLSLQNELNLIYTNSNEYSLRQLRNKIYAFTDLIKSHTSTEIYEKFNIEYDCVYYEMIYGSNDEYTEKVKEDFLNVLKEVIDSL